MKQSELNRAVAHRLGESVGTIVDRGFSLLTELCEERDPLVLDFDDLPPRPIVFPIVEPAN